MSKNCRVFSLLHCTLLNSVHLTSFTYCFRSREIEMSMKNVWNPYEFASVFCSDSVFCV